MSHSAGPARSAGRLARTAALLAALAAFGTPAPGSAAGAPDLGPGVSASFTGQGLRLSRSAGAGGGWTWDLNLRAVGRGTSARSVDAARESGDGSRFEYRRGPVTEWYAKAGPGLEQGFTLSEKPAGTGPLSLHFDLATDLPGKVSDDARSASFASPTGATLHYAGLAAYDARGASLPARIHLGAGGLTLEVDDAGATYPVTIDPLVYLEAKQVAFDASPGDAFGWSVAVDGDTAVVGAPGDDDPTAGADTGAAYVFIRVGAAWILQQKLTASDLAAGDAFGTSVAISGDTIVVGAPADDDDVAGADAGSAYVFTRSNDVWTEQEKLLPPDLAAGDQFGTSVALFLGTAVVGAPEGDGPVADTGSAYVFVFDPAAVAFPRWPLQAELDASDAAAGDAFGTSVSLDQDTAVVGAPAKNGQTGAAYVFTRTDVTWTEEQKLQAGGGNAGDQFGAAVAVSRDTAVVGAPFDDNNGRTDDGSAYVFLRAAGVWNEEDQLFSQNQSNGDHFGASVAISSDAIVVGVPDENNSQGQAEVYTRFDTTWPERLRLRASDRNDGDFYGHAVALSGGSLVVGAYGDDDLINDQGSAYLYFAFEQNVNLEVDTSVDNPQPAEGDTVVFTISVTNWGADDAAVVAIENPFPTDLVFVSSLASRGTYNPSTGLWEIGSLPRYSVASLAITAQAPVGSGGKTVSDTATLLAYDATPDNNTSTVTVRVVPPGATGLLVNPGFEIDTTPADGQPDGWTVKNDPATDGTDCTVAHSGSCSYKVVGAPKKTKKLFQAFAQDHPAGSYTFSMWVKADGVTGNVKAKLQILNKDGTHQKVALVIPTGTYDWTLISMPFTAKEWKSAKVSVNWKGTGTLHLDDVVAGL